MVHTWPRSPGSSRMVTFLESHCNTCTWPSRAHFSILKINTVSKHIIHYSDWCPSNIKSPWPRDQGWESFSRMLNCWASYYWTNESSHDALSAPSGWYILSRVCYFWSCFVCVIFDLIIHVLLVSFLGSQGLSSVRTGTYICISQLSAQNLAQNHSHKRVKCTCECALVRDGAMQNIERASTLKCIRRTVIGEQVTPKGNQQYCGVYCCP